MSVLWQRVPIRVRAGLSAFFLLLALLFLWWVLDWAVPSPVLALRLAEREHVFGPGELVAERAITLESTSTYIGGDRVLVSRSGDQFAVASLERKFWLLWQAESLYVLRPTEEEPLSYSFLAYGFPHGISEEDMGSEYLLCICSSDPGIVRVELTMGLSPGGLSQEEEVDWLRENGTVTDCVSIGDAVFLGRTLLPRSSGGTSVRLRGYGADGRLLYDSFPRSIT